jgi:hypothetical protein
MLNGSCEHMGDLAPVMCKHSVWSSETSLYLSTKLQQIVTAKLLQSLGRMLPTPPSNSLIPLFYDFISSTPASLTCPHVLASFYFQSSELRHEPLCLLQTHPNRLGMRWTDSRHSWDEIWVVVVWPSPPSPSASKNIWKVRRDERNKHRASEPSLLYTSMHDKTCILLVWENLPVNDSIGTSKAQVSITWLMSWIHLAWGKVQARVMWCNVTAIMMSRHLLNGCSWTGSPIWCPNQLQ